MARKTAVLVLAANPRDTPALRLDQEVREIQAGLLRSGSRTFHIRQDWAVRPRDVRRALLEHRPRIVHFSGHGTGDEGLVLEDDNGTSQLVSTSAIAGLFALFTEHVKCVVLNACFSESQAKAIAQHVECVIGMNRAIADHAAIEFAIGFYDAIAAGESYSTAFRFGCNAIELAGLPGHLTPVILRKDTFSSRPPVAEHAPTRRSPTLSRSHGDDFAICSLRDLNNAGWCTAAVMERIEQMDYDNLAGLDATSAGAAKQWEELAENNPDGYAFLTDSGNDIAGYWHFEALPADLYNRARGGELEDGEIALDNVTLLCAPGYLDVYFIIFVVEKKYRGLRANRLLLDAFVDRLHELGSYGITIRRICANAFTPEGVGLCNSLGMKYLQPHSRIGLIYELGVAESDWLTRSRPRRLTASRR
jgi:GNAT superfamily N-acetyltransferase